MNISNKIKELETLRAKAAALEASIASEQQQELAGLPAKYGFSNVDDFLAAFRNATGTRRGRKPGAAAKAAVSKPGRKQRAVITDDTRAQVKKMVADDKTGTEIAKALGISLPSVQNIKKALGLVKARK